MSAKSFFDTNLIIYLYSNDEPTKQKKVFALVESCEHRIISTQVINEFTHVMTKKRHLGYTALQNTIHELSSAFDIVNISLETIKQALEIAQNCHYSYFDSLMIASALENECSNFFSEDLHDTHRVEKTLQIINPFKSMPNL